MHRFTRPLRCPSLFLSALAPIVLGAHAFADELPPSLAHDLGAYAVYGRGGVTLNGAASMADRGSVGSESFVSFPVRTSADGQDSFVAAPSVTLRDASHVHFVYAAALDASPDVTIDHDPAALAPPPVREADWPHLPEITCGGSSITVDSTSSPLTLAPGRYDTITVQQDQTLRLVAGGRYEVCVMKLRAGATVEAHAGTLVLLRDYMTVDGRTSFAGDDACGARWISAGNKLSPAPGQSGFEFIHRSGASNRSLVQGQFFTTARMLLGQNVDYVGRFWAETIDSSGSDGAARTVSDCRAPQCGDGRLDPGEACDDGNNLDGDCCSAFCEQYAAGAACDDGHFCTMHDACDASGHCVGTDDPCDAPDGDGDCSESCNEDTHRCDAPDPDGSACDDDIYCNGADLCASGLCVSHSGSPCAGLDDDSNCNEGCDEATHLCNAPDPAGAPCDDGRFCTIGETCDGRGNCAGGASPCPEADGDANCAESCDELNDTCNAFDAPGSPCDDGLFCTAHDECDGKGRCLTWGDPCLGSAGDGDGDCSESCDEQARACSAPDRDGAPCDDGLACTLGERCISGVCAPSGMTSCDDSNPCTDEFCAPDGTCQRTWNSNPCDDGNPCTTGDQCVRGTCSGTGAVDCRDGDLCTADVCDPTDGTCHHTDAPATDCHVSGRSRTSIEVGYLGDEGDASGRMATTWRGNSDGDATAREELGDPSMGDAFAVCIYDESSGLPELAYRLDFDATTIGNGSWRRKGGFYDLLYKMKASDGTSQGVSAVRLGVDKDGIPKLRMLAGANSGCTDDCRAKFVPPPRRPDGHLFAMQPGMTVQWTSSTGACWSSRYEKASVNTAQDFEARSR